MTIKIIEYKNGKEITHKTYREGTSIKKVCQWSKDFMVSGDYFADRISVIVDGTIYAEYTA